MTNESGLEFENVKGDRYELKEFNIPLNLLIWLKNPKPDVDPFATKLKRDPIVERVRQKLLDRSQKGIGKYGTTLHDSKEDMIARLNHLQQELMDGANYVEWVLQELEK